MLYALILAGGKGTRLYPLSTSNSPKQFLKIINEKSFLRNAVDRIKPLVNNENIYVVTNKEYHDKIKEELSELNEENIYLEPSNKETATCIALAAVKLLKKDKDAVMMVFPSDHHISNEKIFIDTLTHAASVAEKKRALVTIGIDPVRPETGYGYIEMGTRINLAFPTYKVERFTEKPNFEVAKDFILKGTYLWNSGIFVWRADVFLRELEKYLPKIYKSMMEIYQYIGMEEEQEKILEQYNIIDGISVDFGIMQKTRKAYVIKCEFQWDDVGTFESLSRYLPQTESNRTSGNAFLQETENCTVLGGEKLIVGFGISNLVIVECGDVILVMNKNKDSEMKHLVDKLRSEKNKYI